MNASSGGNPASRTAPSTSPTAGADAETPPAPSTRRSGRARGDRLTEAMRSLPRRLFLPPGAADVPDELPAALDEARRIPPVEVVATMLRALELRGDERVLDVGSGSGYQAALLGRLAREVVSVEFDEALAAGAASRLKALGCDNVRVVHGDGAGGWPECAPYQAIVVGAAATELPPMLVDQLDLGGRLVVALGDADAQIIECLHRHMDSLASRTIGGCHLDMLRGHRRTPSSFPWAAPKR